MLGFIGLGNEESKKEIMGLADTNGKQTNDRLFT